MCEDLGPGLDRNTTVREGGFGDAGPDFGVCEDLKNVHGCRITLFAQGGREYISRVRGRSEDWGWGIDNFEGGGGTVIFSL